MVRNGDETHDNKQESPSGWLQSQRLLRFDIFGSPIQLRYPGGGKEYRTACGSCATLFAFLVSLIFFVSQIIVMKDYRETLFTNAISVDYFNQDSAIRSDSNFKIGIGATKDNWKFRAQLEISTESDDFQYVPIPIEVCSEDDYATFYPVRETFEGAYDLLKNSNSLYCLDYSDVEIFGLHTDFVYSVLQIEMVVAEDLVHSCMGRRPGSVNVPAEELVGDDFDESFESCNFGRSKELQNKGFVFTLTNQERFDTQDYSSETPEVKESIFQFFDVPSKPIQYKFQVENTVLELDDNLTISIPGLTENEVELFSVNGVGSQSRIFEDFFTRVQFQYGLSRDARLMTRSVFTFWQVLSDVGGLNGFLISVIALGVSIFTFQKDENYLTSKLYKPHQQSANDKEFLRASKQRSLSQYLQDMLPHACLVLCCLLPQRKDKIFKRARDSFAEETDVVHLLQQLRFLHTIVSSLASATPSVRERLKLRAKFISLKEDSDQSSVSEQDSSLVEQRLADNSSVEISNLSALAAVDKKSCRRGTTKAQSYPHTARLEPTLANSDSQMAAKLLLISENLRKKNEDSPKKDQSQSFAGENLSQPVKKA